MVAVASRINVSIHTSRVDSTELLRSSSEYRTPQALICGHSAALWQNFTLVIHFSQARTKLSNWLMLWKSKAFLPTIWLNWVAAEISSLKRTPAPQSLSLTHAVAVDYRTLRLCKTCLRSARTPSSSTSLTCALTGTQSIAWPLSRPSSTSGS